MHPSIQILKEVIRLTESEFQLLELEDASGLAESAAQRDGLLKEAWERKVGCNENAFVGLLITIQELQRKLARIAEAKFAETRDALNNNKKSRNAILGYCRIGASYGRRPREIFAKLS